MNKNQNLVKSQNQETVTTENNFDFNIDNIYSVIDSCYRQIATNCLKTLAFKFNRRSSNRCKEIYSSLRCEKSLEPEMVANGYYKRDSGWHKKGMVKWQEKSKEVWIFTDDEGEEIVSEIAISLLEMAKNGQVWINNNRLYFGNFKSRKGVYVSYYCKLYNVIENYLSSITRSTDTAPAWEAMDENDKEKALDKAYKEHDSSSAVFVGGFIAIENREDFNRFLDFLSRKSKNYEELREIIFWQASYENITKKKLAELSGFNYKKVQRRCEELHNLYQKWTDCGNSFTVKNATSVSWGVRMGAGTGSNATYGGYTEGHISSHYEDGPAPISKKGKGYNIKTVDKFDKLFKPTKIYQGPPKNTTPYIAPIKKTTKISSFKKTIAKISGQEWDKYITNFPMIPYSKIDSSSINEEYDFYKYIANYPMETYFIPAEDSTPYPHTVHSAANYDAAYTAVQVAFDGQDTMISRYCDSMPLVDRIARYEACIAP